MGPMGPAPMGGMPAYQTPRGPAEPLRQPAPAQQRQPAPAQRRQPVALAKQRRPRQAPVRQTPAPRAPRA